MPVIIGRHINGVTFNSIEFLHDLEGQPMQFTDEAAALQFIAENDMGNPEDFIIESI